MYNLPILQSEKCTTTDGLVEEMFKSLFGSSDTDETKQKVGSCFYYFIEPRM